MARAQDLRRTPQSGRRRFREQKLLKKVMEDQRVVNDLRINRDLEVAKIRQDGPSLYSRGDELN